METNQPTFCGVCRHPAPNHYPSCPVLTGQPIQGIPESYQQVMAAAEQHHQNPQDLQPQMQNPLNMLQQFGGIVPPRHVPKLEDGYEVAKIYRDARQRLLEELKIQVEINHRQGRELIELRLENRDLKETIQAITVPAPVPWPETPIPVTPENLDDSMPF